jgi:N-acylneuraminate cytidylyltransferase
VIGGRCVLGLIPARGGSKGVPGKNILPIRGRPLIQWTIEAARAARCVDRLVLSSDDPAIMAVAVGLGCEAPFTRPAQLATDEASSIDVVIDAIERLPGYDIVVLLQPTSPLRNAQDIDGVVELLLASGAPACVSVRPAEDHPFWTFRLDEQGALSRFVAATAELPRRRQDLPPAWCLNGAVYAAHIQWLLRERSFLVPQTVGYRMPAERSLDIDTWADVEQLQSIAGSEQQLAQPSPQVASR